VYLTPAVTVRKSAGPMRLIRGPNRSNISGIKSGRVIAIVCSSLSFSENLIRPFSGNFVGNSTDCCAVELPTRGAFAVAATTHLHRLEKTGEEVSECIDIFATRSVGWLGGESVKHCQKILFCLLLALSCAISGLDTPRLYSNGASHYLML
jgi:hypothetical protein